MNYKLKKRIVDLIYKTNQVKQKYQLQEPTETIFATDACKGIAMVHNQDVRRGSDWTTAQRAVILLTDKKIVCGKWIIPLDNICSAILLKYTSFLTGKGQILKIQTKDNKFYQFGMEQNSEWTNQHILPLTIEKGQMKHSAYSIIIRLLALGLLVYWLYEGITTN